MAEPEQDFHAVHINDVEIEKSDHGYTKHLMHSKGKGFPSIQVRHWGPETDIDVHRHPYNEMFLSNLGSGPINFLAVRATH